MYDINSIDLVYPNGQRGALSNICHGNGMNKFATVVDLKDTVEDSTDANELLRNLSRLNLVGMNHLSIDRDTPSYTRIKGDDPIGNICYLKIQKEY